MIEHLTIPIQDELSKMDKVLSSEISSGIETVDSIARYVVKNDGKRIRPALFLLASRMAGAKGENLPRFAAAIELLHAANLLHADVADDNKAGKGHSSGRAKWGNQASVLIGDFFLCRAARIFSEHSDGRMIDAATSAIGAVTESALSENSDGALRPFGNPMSQQTQGAALREPQGAAALFAFAGRAAAIVAGLEENFENALMSFGGAVGISFYFTSTLAKEYSEKAKQNLLVFKPSIERDSLLALADYAASCHSE